MIEREHGLLGRHLFGEAMDEVDFGAHGPGRAGRRFAHGLQDVLGRADVVGGPEHVERHLGVHDDAHAGMLPAHGVDLLDA